MPPSASKSPLSPSELAQLEHAFATDPASEAYRPLAEAYLAMGRYMEAMVVCKKGVKAHPDSASARVLLARVYAEQGKDKKALEELQGALQVAANDVPALRMMGAILCKVSDPSGPEHLKRALAAAPADAETLELCRKYGVPVPAAEAAKPPPPEAAQPVARPATTASPAAVAAPAVAAAPSPAPQAPRNAPVAAPAAAAPAAPASPTPAAPAVAKPVAQPPAPKPAAAPAKPARPAISYEELAARYGDDDTSARPSGSSTNRLIATGGLVVLGLLFLAGFWFYKSSTAERNRSIDRLLKEMQAELAHDSFVGYQRACQSGETIVNDLDNDLFSAHAYLAYAYAIRWGEHGEGELAEKSARDHLARAKEAQTRHGHLIAAEAYVKFFGGDVPAAEGDLERAVEQSEKEGRKSSLLLSALGIVQMHSGQLEKSLKNLKAAQALAPMDPRINAALGNAYRRAGSEAFAANAFEQALRYEHNHAEAQLGVALMGIDTGRYKTAGEYVDRLLNAEPPPSPRQLALARMAHAILLDEEGKRDQAEREQSLALESDSRNGELLVLKSRRLLRSSRHEEAVAAIRDAIRLDPKRASFYAELARALVTKPGGAKEAVDSVKQALQIMPSSPNLLILLGDAYRAAEDYDKAKESYDKALAEAKQNLPEAVMALADLAHARKDWNAAVELYEKAKNAYLSSTERQAYALTQMGLIYEETGDKKKAKETYTKASEVEPSYAPPYFLVGRMYVADKDKKVRGFATQLLEKYLTLAPRGEYAAEAAKLLQQR